MGGIALKIAPIIHTRTYSCDFNSDFLVRPKCFMDFDIKWARKYILGSTREIDGLQGVRWLIVDNGKYRMAGVVGFLKDIYSKCQLSEDDKLKSEELFCDNKGRLVYAFIGIVIDKHNNDNYGNLSLDYLWKIYLDKIYPIWKSTYQEIMLEDFKDVDIETAVDIVTMESVMVSEKEFYEANAEMDYKLFLYLLCKKDNTDFSFCSNILDFNMAKQSEFSIITTSQNIITRITKENDIKSGSVINNQSSQIIPSVNASEPLQIPNAKKKSIVVLMIGFVISAIIILILLLTGGTDQNRKFGQQISKSVKIEIILCFEKTVEIVDVL